MVDDEGGGNSADPTVIEHYLSRAHQHRVSNPVALNKRSQDRINLVIERYSDDLNPLISELLPELQKMGDFLAARAAPGCKEVEQHNPSLEVIQSVNATVQILEFKVRSRL
jgi:hypothetical protein